MARKVEMNRAETAMLSGMMPTHICTAAMLASGKAAAICATMGTGTSMPMMHMAAA